MRFADIIGNASVARALASMADSGRVAHAMLLYENEGCGALALAMAYLQYLNCANPSDGDSCGECPSCRQMSKYIHPDVHFVFPVNKGPKTSDEKPTSESYIKYWRELAVADPYFVEADMSKFMAQIIDFMNHDLSLSNVLTSTEKIKEKLNQYNCK